MLPDAVAVTYDAPADGGSNNGAPYPVWGGRDIITGQNASSGATVTNTVQYEFSPVTTYRLSPNPIAARGHAPLWHASHGDANRLGYQWRRHRRVGAALPDQHGLACRLCDRHWRGPTQRDGLHNGEHADAHLDADAVHHQRQWTGVDQLHAVIDHLRGR